MKLRTKIKIDGFKIIFRLVGTIDSPEDLKFVGFCIFEKIRNGRKSGRK